ncbi:MAG: amidase [Pirellulales bacterium]
MQPLPTIAELARRIRDRSLSPTTLVQQCLARIDAWEDRLHAWAYLDRAAALTTADELAEEAQAGEYRGPLHGIPIGVKDIIDVAGMPTRAGSPLCEDVPAAHDATVVARLRAAGAIILGKTVTTEFAFFTPSDTANPWSPEHTPGGSSSGSAAAVASGMCLAALATQTGGSITRPASYCGVPSCKPTFRENYREGLMLVSPRLDHIGVIGRCAADLGTIVAVMFDEQELANGSDVAGQPPRIGLIESYFMETADEPTRSAVRAALDRLRRAGASFTLTSLPDSFTELHKMHRRIMLVEAAASHRERFAAHRDRYSSSLAEMLDEGLATSQEAYQVSVAHQQRFREEIGSSFAGVDVLVTPATPTAAPADRATTGDPRFNSPWSYSGLPTVSLPCGLGSDRMPVSLQLVAPAGGEQRLLSIAAWCEERLSFSEAPPLLS